MPINSLGEGATGIGRGEIRHAVAVEVRGPGCPETTNFNPLRLNGPRPTQHEAYSRAIPFGSLTKFSSIFYTKSWESGRVSEKEQMAKKTSFLAQFPTCPSMEQLRHVAFRIRLR